MSQEMKKGFTTVQEVASFIQSNPKRFMEMMNENMELRANIGTILKTASNSDIMRMAYEMQAPEYKITNPITGVKTLIEPFSQRMAQFLHYQKEQLEQNPYHVMEPPKEAVDFFEKLEEDGKHLAEEQKKEIVKRYLHDRKLNDKLHQLTISSLPILDDKDKDFIRNLKIDNQTVQAIEKLLGVSLNGNNNMEKITNAAVMGMTLSTIGDNGKFSQVMEELNGYLVGQGKVKEAKQLQATFTKLGGLNMPFDSRIAFSSEILQEFYLSKLDNLKGNGLSDVRLLETWAKACNHDLPKMTSLLMDIRENSPVEFASSMRKIKQQTEHQQVAQKIEATYNTSEAISPNLAIMVNKQNEKAINAEIKQEQEMAQNQSMGLR